MLKPFEDRNISDRPNCRMHKQDHYTAGDSANADADSTMGEVELQQIKQRSTIMTCVSVSTLCFFITYLLVCPPTPYYYYYKRRTVV